MSCHDSQQGTCRCQSKQQHVVSWDLHKLFQHQQDTKFIQCIQNMYSILPSTTVSQLSVTQASVVEQAEEVEPAVLLYYTSSSSIIKNLKMGDSKMLSILILMLLIDIWCFSLLFSAILAHLDTEFKVRLPSNQLN